MSRIRFHDEENAPWTGVKGFAISDKMDAAAQAEHNVPIRLHELGDEHSLQLFEVKLDPNMRTDVHAHEADEIIYVLSGEMHFGTKVLPPGSSVFVTGNSFYSFGAGPDGLHILNFRPRLDTSYITRESRIEVKKLATGEDA